MREGDYVQVTKRVPPLIRRGTRGTVLRIEGDWVWVIRPTQGNLEGSFCAPIDNLAVIDRGLNL